MRENHLLLHLDEGDAEKPSELHCRNSLGRHLLKQVRRLR